MKNSIKKLVAYALLPGFLAVNYGRASEYSERINIENADSIVFTYEQEPALEIGLKTLKKNTTYLINSKFIVKPDFGLDKILGYVQDYSKNLQTKEGIEFTNNKILRLENLKKITNDMSNEGLEAFVNAAKDGIITQQDYETLHPGDVFVMERLEGNYGSVDRGVIVKVPGTYAKKDSEYISEETVEKEEFKQPQTKETKQPETREASKTIQAPKIDVQNVIIPIKQDDKNWCRKHPVGCGFLIGAGTAGLVYALSNRDDNGGDDTPDTGGITGGNEF